ncbi:Ribokinase-like protein [Aspergillus heteromorphus CBS 117.55]|uniref:ATP-dependent (S)-NAD(P)H-hydrate dehydratase n=1 Tax=Aspergillus heteromorphus CBS 117.55 TaxID=1448321 RepID=A0A317VHB6_9EURO|nr:Ribokinase-like protein [Aspergillus heteromorphus CBS 117.55]PWY73703.1 Ribokinase-like protein [Aspergillus heteromorphus CBS 117.55]
MEAHHVSASSKALLKKVRNMVPPMLEKFHKGQHGRVAVIGGCADYTGAPYFSSMASARLGCDMSHVICEKSAGVVIKTYSPNLMVHPLLPSSDSVKDPKSIDAPSLASPIIAMLSRLHCLVIGPGLGRDGVTLKVVTEVMKEARSQSIPFVLDADGLLLVTEDPELVKGYKECILTPNVNEFSRLAKALGIDVPSQAQVGSKSDGDGGEATRACEQLSKALGGVTIIQKGPHDIISNGVTSIVSDIQGGLKRSGGQGDTLTGSLGTFMAWRAAYHNGLWDSGERDNEKEAQTKQEVQAELESENQRMSPVTTLLLAAFAGSSITRECSRRAFLAKGRSMQASDLTDEVHESFLKLIGEPEASKMRL